MSWLSLLNYLNNFYLYKMKACKRCGSDSNGYYPQTRSKDGLRPYCKMCDKAQSRITYSKNKELVKIKRLKKV